MIKYLIPLLLLTSCASLPKKQPVAYQFKKVATLPDVINESSGLIVIDKQLITHNDSGALPALHQIDTTGIITKNVKYEYLYNQDWEAIAQSNNAIHIADVGNNKGNRKDLKIYNIVKTGIWQPEIDLDIAAISYAAQKDFTVRNRNHSYDAESVIVIDEIMYLFSKDWINFSTTVYSFPIYKDAVLKELQTINVKGLVTDAAFNTKNTVLLCGYNQSLQAFIIELTFKNGAFTFVKKTELPIDEGAQIEAIAYYGTNAQGDDVYYLTSEAVQLKLGDDVVKTAGSLYKLIWK